MLVDINLLPEKEKKPLSNFSFATIIIILTLLLSGASGFIYMMQAQDLEELDRKLTQQKSINLSLEHELEGGEEAKQAQLIDELSQQLATNISGYMTEIMNELPRDGELNASKFNDSQITLTVTTAKNEQAVRFYQSLQDMSLFHEVVIHTINFDENEDRFVTNYTIHLQEQDEGGIE